jgi:hypothetical protein
LWVPTARRVFDALLYLRLTSLAGRVRYRLKRLRQPKYLFGTLVGVAYIYFFFVRRVGRDYRATVPTLPGDTPELLGAFAALGLLCVAVASWILPRARVSLSFSEPEIAFLFPAPVKRRTLIHYRLISSQAALALTSLILSLVSNRWRLLGGSMVTHAIGWWIILATINLHLTGSSFAITRLMDRGVTSLRRRLVTFALIAALLLSAIAWVFRSVPVPTATDLAGAEALSRYLSAVLTSGPLAWLLALPKLTVGPFLAPDNREFLLALGPALLLLAGHYLWVLRTEVAFEEASLLRAEKRAARLAAMRQGDVTGKKAVRKVRRDPFRLFARGRPEIAFLWKNLLSTVSYLRPRTAFIATAVIVVGCTWLANTPYRPFLGVVLTIAIASGTLALVLGPQIARWDLRSDLVNADMLKTYPLHGWQVVLGQLLTPLVVLSVIVWLAILAIALALPVRELTGVTPGLRAALAVALALLAPPFFALQLLVQNAIAVLFPAWVQTVSNRTERGLDVMGQRIIFLAGQLLIVAVAVLPAVLVAALVFFICQWLTGPPVAITLALLSVLAILCIETWIGVRLLGERFERFDVSSELRP